MFRREWLLRNGFEKDMFVLHAAGDSMSPTISDGDIVLFRKQALERPGIYAFRHEDVLRLKRLEFVGKKVSATSETPNYAQELLSAKEVKVLGSAMWVGGEL